MIRVVLIDLAVRAVATYSVACAEIGAMVSRRRSRGMA